MALLDLAQALAVVAGERGERDSLAKALALLEDAFGPRSPLPPLLAQAWLQTRGEKMRALALGWAREQVRRALAEILERPRRPGRGAAVSSDAAAWLLLAAAEGESHEVDGAVGDRLKLVCSQLSLS